MLLRFSDLTIEAKPRLILHLRSWLEIIFRLDAIRLPDLFSFPFPLLQQKMYQVSPVSFHSVLLFSSPTSITGRGKSKKHRVRLRLHLQFSL